MRLKIDRLNITLPGPTQPDGGMSHRGAQNAGQQFAQALARRLAAPDLTHGQALRIDRLDLPPIPQRPGETPAQLADRVARAIHRVIRRERGAP